jgi:glycerophosphoryl diester phosphodiesterase
VLDRFPRARVIIEMKVASEQLALAVVDAIKGADAVARVCVGSFHQRALDVLRREEPDIATSGSVGETRWTLYRSWIRWPRASTRPHVAFQVPERAGAHRVVSPRFVRQAHDEGRTVQVWVVDREEDCRRLLAWGVDGLISDRPDVAASVRNRWLQGGLGKRATRGGGGR